MTNERDCDIDGCHSKTSNIINVGDKDKNGRTYCTVGMCSYHYRSFHSVEGLDKPFTMKDDVYAEYKYN